MRSLLLLTAIVPALALAEGPAPTDLLELARQGYSLAASEYRAGQGDLDTAARWSKRIYEIQKDAHAPAAGTDYVYRMKDLEKVAQTRFKQGSVRRLDTVEATFLRARAEEQVKKK